MQKWTRRPDSRPEELIEAALELCAERGVHATRVADVAARAGVTVGTVYRYFRSKDALVKAALAHGARPAARAAQDRPGATIPALADAVRRWGTHFKDAGTRSIRVALSDPARDQLASPGVVDDAVAEISALIATGIERKEMRADLSPTPVARALVGALLLGPLFGGSGDGVEGIDAISAIAARGLRPDGPTWRATP